MGDAHSRSEKKLKNLTMRLVPTSLRLWMLTWVFCSSVSLAEECERLKASLTYTQEEAPRDLSGVLPVVVERVNRVLQGVVDVEVEWTGADLHGRVGEHMIKCRVTRLASVLPTEADDSYVDDDGRSVISQCFHVPFTILDTDECKLPRGHAMHHRCHHSSLCVNTIGGYECLCPRIKNAFQPSVAANTEFWVQLASQDRNAWEVSFNTSSRTTCPSMATTHGCCPDRAHTKDGALCRSAFRCPVDPCALESGNDCSGSATCVRKSSPVEDPNYICECPAGFMGNGLKCRPGVDPKPAPKVMYDGVTPTEETIKNNYYCDCTRPVVDACSGFPPCKGKHEVCTVTAGNVPKCACKPGYFMHEKYGCVDEKPPMMKLKNDPNGDQILRLKQGDVYKEYAVDIQDENAEEYLRSLKIAYSRPLPHGCLTDVGEFHVNYTIATPWTSPPYVRVTRRVIVEDIDECSLDVAKYEKICPELVPKCDFAEGATCVNTMGSYTCKCPIYTSGDGFVAGLSFAPGHTPEGYKGGSGCHDTSKPVINLLGPNPKVFRVCECKGIAGIMGPGSGKEDAELRSSQQKHYGADIKDLIRATAGAELCATHSNRSPEPSDCVVAYDETYKGRVDLAKEVVVGEPVQKAALHWQVPYDVKDKAGNEAITVWRDVVVEEVDLLEVESAIRQEVLKHKEADIQRAVAVAIAEDRKRRDSELSTSSRNRRQQPPASNSCPKCPPCDCSGSVDAASCDAICESRSQTCPLHEEALIIRVAAWLEQILPPTVVPLVLLFIFACGVFLIARFTLTFIFNPQANQRDYYANVERERALRDAVMYYRPEGNMTNGAPPAPAPRASSYANPNDSFFTPRAGTDGAVFRSPPPVNPAYTPPSVGGSAARTSEQDHFDVDSIYETRPLITPSKRGDGVGRRSPFVRT